MEKRKKGIDPEKGIKYLPLFYLSIGIIFGSFAIYLFPLVSGENSRYDLPNLTTLIIEIAFGIAITFTVYLYAKRQHKENQSQQKKIENLITDIQKIEGNQQKLIDVQEKFRNEQHDFAIHRVRSYLSSLHSTIDSLMKLDIDPNIPVHKEMERLLDFKNEMITQLDHIVNQSGSILEQNYLQQLTNIIELSRTNPKPSSTDDGLSYLDISHCQGILSQIEDLLKIIPNPPV